MKNKLFVDLDNNQLSLIFIIQESIIKILGNNFYFLSLKILNPLKVIQNIRDLKDFQSGIPEDILLADKKCFDFSAVVSHNDDGCEIEFELKGYIIGSFSGSFFIIEEIFINDGSKDYHLYFSEEGIVSKNISIH